MMKTPKLGCLERQNCENEKPEDVKITNFYLVKYNKKSKYIEIGRARDIVQWQSECLAFTRPSLVSISITKKKGGNLGKCTKK
jgi:hypothetical protein